MKKNKVYMLFGALFVCATLFVFGSCAEDFDEPTQSGLPTAAPYAECFKITVDDETNVATFSFEGTTDVAPVWVDGKDIYGQTTWTKEYYRKGEYSVWCKVRNANGISRDSVERTFTITHGKYRN